MELVNTAADRGHALGTEGATLAPFSLVLLRYVPAAVPAPGTLAVPQVPVVPSVPATPTPPTAGEPAVAPATLVQSASTSPETTQPADARSDVDAGGGA
jgi:hypothetical protein